MVFPASAQVVPKVSSHELPNVYREARLQLLIDRILAKNGGRLIPRPSEDVSNKNDTLYQWILTKQPGYVEPVVEEVFELKSWKLVKRLERQGFSKQFSKVKWAYLGNNYLTALDTTLTRILRAHMQAFFGPPTRTLAELNVNRHLRMDEYIQFEYWFVLNDTIPIMVMDANGPLDRGFVVAGDHRYRDKLMDLRQDLLTPIFEEGPAAYVDYFYHYPARRWYKTGYDGRRYFRRVIGQPDLAQGRPKLARPGG